MTIPSLSVQVNGVNSVTDDQFNTYVQGGANVAALRNFIGLPGMEVFLVGYTNPADGGQGAFFWNPSGTGPDDNGVNNIVPFGAMLGCWTRIPQTLTATQAIIQCTATGTNAIVLTPNSGSPVPTSYANGQIYGFYAANSSSGSVTINFNSLGVLNAYNGDGGAFITTNSIYAGSYYLFAYNSTLNSGSGGFQLLNNVTVYNASVLANSFVPRSSVVPSNNGMYLPLANTVGIAGNSQPVAVFLGIANSVNYVKFTNATTGNQPFVQSVGADANVELFIGSQGTGGVMFITNAGVTNDRQFEVINTASAVNHFQVTGGATGSSAAVLTAVGSDTNINVVVTPQGSGVLQTLASYTQTTATAANLNIDSSGNIKRSTSSLKYKQNVADYDKGVSAVLALRPVYYESKNEEDKHRYAGLIAEEVHAAGLPEFVQYKDGEPDALAYGNMVALLISAVKEQQKQIDELKAKLIQET